MTIFCTFPTINISKLNFWLVICIAKNFIWTTLKMIFSIFRFFCTLRFQIFKYCPIITTHTSVERWLIQMTCKSHFQKTDPYDWSCAPGSCVIWDVPRTFTTSSNSAVALQLVWGGAIINSRWRSSSVAGVFQHLTAVQLKLKARRPVDPDDYLH